MDYIGAIKVFTKKQMVATVIIFDDIGNHNDQQ